MSGVRLDCAVTRARARYIGQAAILGLSSCLLAGCAPAAHEGYTSLQGATMGTYYRLQAQCPVAPTSAAVDAQLLAFNKVFSTYDPDSELSRLNRAAATQWVSVSADLYAVLQVAAKLGADSGGAFDPTIGALVDLWGFGAPRSSDGAPSAQTVAQAREGTGLAALEFAEPVGNDYRVRLLSPRQIDLSALAKGRGVDELFESLRAQGCTDLLVDIGGEIRVAGQSSKQRPWRLAIEQPGKLTPDSDVLPVLQLGEGAVATSGDYLNYRELDGQRYSHLIDPRTGYPITHGLASVTVWHPEAMWADGYATLISIVGPEQGQRLAEQAKLAVALLVRGPNGFSTWQSPEFQRRFGPPGR